MRHTTEFDRQIQSLLEKKYPEFAGMSESKFLQIIDPLRDALKNIPDTIPNLDDGILPFVIVIRSVLVDTQAAMSQTEKNAKNGTTKLFPLSPSDFHPISDEHIPDSQAYLLMEIDRGDASRNVRPQDALISIKKSYRIPLTIDEGIAIVTQFPDFLQKNHCFSLLASRHPGDQRVPAIWINAQKHPNLGWCWDGNPHTWLGSASGKLRIGY